MKHLLDGRGGGNVARWRKTVSVGFLSGITIPRCRDRQEAKRRRPGGLFLASPAVAALQAIDGDNKVGPLEHFDQPVKDALLVVRARLQIFFKDALSLAYGLKRQLLIGHNFSLNAEKQT
jgi:hypothetical protein